MGSGGVDHLVVGLVPGYTITASTTLQSMQKDSVVGIVTRALPELRENFCKLMQRRYAHNVFIQFQISCVTLIILTYTSTMNNLKIAFSPVYSCSLCRFLHWQRDGSQIIQYRNLGDFGGRGLSVCTCHLYRHRQRGYT